MIRTGLVIVAALSLGFAPLPRMKGDLERLQGSWVYGDLEARFEKDRLTFSFQGKVVNVYRVTIDAKATPKRYDLVGVGGGAADGRKYAGIYRIDGDTLTTASRGSGDGARPTAFESGRGTHVETYRRKGR